MLSSDELSRAQVVRTEPLIQGLDKPLFVISEPIMIHDRNIIFFDKNLDAFFKIRVKQSKGEGAAYADDMKYLNSEHKEILSTWLSENNRDMAKTIEMIRFMITEKRKKQRLENQSNKKYMKPGSVQGRTSELFRKGIFYKKDANSKYYFIDIEKAQKALESGEF